MESQRINSLLQKYFEAETNLDEENELITYFTSGEVDENLKMYVPMFSGMKEFSVVHGKGFGILQEMVQNTLKIYPAVSEYHFARPEDGGTGKTIVTLS